MVFGGKKKSRVIEEEDEATKRARLLAEVAANVDVLNKFGRAFIDIQLMMWKEVWTDNNIPQELKYKVWEHSTKEFWETVRSGGIFTMTEVVKNVGRIIRDALIKALEERD